MPLTSLLDMKRLKGLFDKSDRGDIQAQTELRSFQNSPEITVLDRGREAKLDMPGLNIPFLQSLKLGKTGGDLSAQPSSDIPQAKPAQTGDPMGDKPKRNWGQLADKASVALTGIAQAFSPSYRGSDASSMAAERLRNDQMDQLKRRHDMWDTAWQSSQQLPMDIVQDPEFASLAQAKMALDKDMADGKVDNEKNVSLYLTELARHKKSLDQRSALSKIADQAALQGQAKQAQLDAGTLYNFEGAAVSPEDYARLSSTRSGQQAELSALDKRLSAQEADSKADRASRERIAGMGAADREADNRRLLMSRGLAGLDALVSQGAKRIAGTDLLGKPAPVSEEHFIQSLIQNDDALLNLAKQAGISVELDTPMGSKIGNRQFDNSEQGMLDAMTYLYQILRTQ